MADTANLEYSTAVDERDMQITPAARAKLSALMAEVEEEIQGIRVFVTGGGCGGMTYGMTYAEDISEYDSALEGDGFKVVVDTVALNYLQGCEIDFAEDNFKFKNVFQAVGGSGACGGCGGGGF